MVQRFDEGQHVARGGVVDVTARLIGLGFQGKLEVVALVEHVFAQVVHRLAAALDGRDGIFARVRFGSLAAAPEDVNFGAQFHAQVNGVHRLLQGVGPHVPVVAGEGPIAEGGIGEQVGRGHRHDQPGFVQRSLEIAHDFVSLGRGGVDGDRSLSWKLTPQAPTSASRCTNSTGDLLARTASPKGSRPTLPTVHRPKVNLCSGFGSYISSSS
jgi:hypothetical protein